MKFSTTLVSLSLVLAGSLVNAAHISNLHHLKQAQVHGRRSGPSATYSSSTASATSSVTPTSSSSSAAASPTSTGSSSGCSFSSGIKRGLSFNDASLTSQFTSGQVSWAYNWGQTYSGSLPDGVAFIPMLWSDADSFTSTWQTNAQAAIDNGTEFLMGCPFAGKAKLVGPAITNGGAPMGETWLNEFIGNCTQCTIDIYAMHIYDSATNEAYYKEYISNFASTYNKTVWVTEVSAERASARRMGMALIERYSLARPATTRPASARTPGLWTQSATSSTATAASPRLPRPTSPKRLIHLSLPHCPRFRIVSSSLSGSALSP
ncbi:glycosyl hydrolase catalytic core-domain-containing protein [Fomitopsis serialis]|uniref:glycosyl hydrolase catalytic core-domain-containing protein n=1 Tax=Fomitopsis serialis TaxID=139415 RepID=UPI00200722B1|nr:glycosyl hydrolase catalytic core-domain-containing protein [Neoantrodia serialis]KAH9918075.1 glycosyl hydrolase catalytic core-domain-containing protein [Neoantrodia serialis]